MYIYIIILSISLPCHTHTHISTGVGKTCLLLRYANDSFSPTFITTIGIDFKIKNLELDGCVEVGVVPPKRSIYLHSRKQNLD